MSPFFSSSRKCSHVVHLPTRFEFAIKTRGASRCVRTIPTGLPDCTRSVSSSSSSLSALTMASNAAQLRAAFPMPPYTTRSSGRSATSGSRLFMSMRSAASCTHPLHERSVPRVARIGPRALTSLVLFGRLGRDRAAVVAATRDVERHAHLALGSLCRRVLEAREELFVVLLRDETGAHVTLDGPHVVRVLVDLLGHVRKPPEPEKELLVGLGRQ